MQRNDNLKVLEINTMLQNCLWKTAFLLLLHFKTARRKHILC